MSAHEKPKATMDRSTELALSRTLLAYQRTLMAWIRTAASLISFGFTIYKFFDYLRDKGDSREGKFFGPRQFATALILIGLVSLVFAVVQHRLEVKALRKTYGHVPYSLATVVGGMVGLLGVITLIVVILRQ